MKSILWVEDEIDQFRAFSFLVNRDYIITHQKDYHSAIKKINEFEFDLFIIDIIIPSGNDSLIDFSEYSDFSNIYFGIELIKKIRVRKPDAPIIALSVIADQRIVDATKCLGNNITYLSKYDCDAADIKEVVHNSIEFN